MADTPVRREKSAPLRQGNKFANPWDTWLGTAFNPKNFLHWKFREKDGSNIPKSKEELDKLLPMHKPDFTPPPVGEHMQFTWIGHATVFVQYDGFSILTDPIFSNHCSPIYHTGPRRYRSPPCRIEDLPPPNIVVISHNHYDHLDKASVRKIHATFGEKVQWCVPLGLTAWFNSLGIHNVAECTWWESIDVPLPHGSASVTCLPCQHWSTRTVLDRCQTLWSSWAVTGPSGRKFYFGGDTGYCPEFANIGMECGPFDLAAIPIGCYCPRWFMKDQHIGPDEAVKVHQEVRSKFSIGIHWGTFHMGSSEYFLEPKTLLAEEVQKAGLAADCFIAPEHGRTTRVP